MKPTPVRSWTRAFQDKNLMQVTGIKVNIPHVFPCGNHTDLETSEQHIYCEHKGWIPIWRQTRGHGHTEASINTCGRRSSTCLRDTLSIFRLFIMPNCCRNGRQKSFVSSWPLTTGWYLFHQWQYFNPCPDSSYIWRPVFSSACLTQR